MSEYGLVAVIALIILGVFFILYMIPFRLWIAAISSGVSMSIFSLIGMRLRRVPPTQIVLPKIKATKAGIDTDTDKLEAHFLAGGHVDHVINALVAAAKADIDLD
ncbi:MAG TPA: UPF0365 family protein, partial [Spirochaetes bacterium]|nr:UPF0365 family protein [Spirochaetota bacterium]